MTGLQDTSNQTFRQLFGNGLTYEIPKFQRDYSWEPEQWDDLWQDIQSVLSSKEPHHYMGYLVLQTTNSKVFQVIDGQQRLTTMSIMILGVLKALQDLVSTNVDAERNGQRLNTLRNSYVGYLDPVTLVAANKLKLNRNNDDYYRTYLAPLAQPRIRGINASERLMKGCFQWFYDRIRKTFATGEALAQFVDTIVDRLFFTVIKVSDELNAFKVFETLNARGVQLSSADLLKNYLFSVVDTEPRHPSELSEMEHLWSKAIGNLGSERFPEFLRTFWNSHNKNVRKNDLFKVIRASVKNKGDAFRLLRDLNANSDIYMALRDPDDELWKGKQRIADRLRELKMYQVRQPFPLLLSAHRHLGEPDFERVLDACSVISMRYNVIGGLNPNEQDRVYNEAALKINGQKKFEMTWLREVYPEDENFVTEFSNTSFKDTSRNNKIVRYILAKIEKRKYSADIDPFGETYTIEHILPESPSTEWSVDDDVLERCVYRLGNLTLLENPLNKSADNHGFAKKRVVYSTSTLGISRAVAEHYEKWDEDDISSRQKQLAKWARDIWSIAF